MFCKKCGAELRPNAKFCTTCGAPVSAAETQTVQPKIQTNIVAEKKTSKAPVIAALVVAAILVCGALGFFAARLVLQKLDDAKAQEEEAYVQEEETSAAPTESAATEASEAASAAPTESSDAESSAPTESGAPTESAASSQSAAPEESASPDADSQPEGTDGGAAEADAYTVTIQNSSAHITVASADTGAKSGDTVLIQLQAEDGYEAIARLTDSDGNAVAGTMQNKILSFTMPDSDVTVYLSETALLRVVKDEQITISPEGDTYWASGDTVTLQYSIADEYKISEIHAVASDGTEVAVQNDAQTGQCSFTMPDQAVTLTITAAARTYTHTYTVYTGDYTWWEAYKLCQSYGGRLAVVNTAEAYSAVCSAAATSELTYLWLGATNAYQFQEDGAYTAIDVRQWNWVDGSGVDTAGDYWFPGEPSGFDGDVEENYLCLWNVESDGTDYAWTFNDQYVDIYERLPTASGRIGFVCEYITETP